MYATDKKFTELTIDQVLTLQWFLKEGFYIEVTGMGQVWFHAEGHTVSGKEQPWINVTDVFLANTESYDKLSDTLYDLAVDAWCDDCEEYILDGTLSVGELVTGTIQICGDCRIDRQEAEEDPYTLRGLSRSDFY